MKMKLALLLPVAAMLAACNGPFTKDGDLGPMSAEEAHPITVAPEVANLTLDVPVGTRKLSPDLEAQARAFIAMYRARGHGGLIVERPSNGVNAANAGKIADQVVRLAKEEGIAANDIVATKYAAPAGKPGGVSLKFTRFTATASPCGDWSQNANESFQNNMMPDFGCSMQNNVAAMIEDPRDLVTPRTMEAADAERRATVMKTYRAGDQAGSKLGSDQRANISKVAE